MSMIRLALLGLGAALLVTGCSQTPSSSRPPETVAAVPQPQSSPAVRDAQQRLRAVGAYAGEADGIWGSETQAAVERFQRNQGLPVTGQLDAATMTALRTEPARSSGPPNVVIQAADPTSVRTVQNRLRQLGFYDGQADGVWGPSTQVALERFQRARGLQPSGQLTNATVNAMGLDPSKFPVNTPSVSAPLDPDVVRNIQSRLREQGFYTGRVDGKWGPGSETAVERFQRSRGMQPTGDLTPATLAALGLDPNNLAGSAPTSGRAVRR
jgi:peptidoglycan hydrolase-like protein with peptidoglycan-binding domain